MIVSLVPLRGPRLEIIFDPLHGWLLELLDVVRRKRVIDVAVFLPGIDCHLSLSH